MVFNKTQKKKKKFYHLYYTIQFRKNKFVTDVSSILILFGVSGILLKNKNYVFNQAIATK